MTPSTPPQQTIRNLATRASSLCIACTTGDLQQLASSVTSFSKPPTIGSGPSSPDKKSGTTKHDDTTPGNSAPSKDTPTQAPIVAVPLPTTAPTPKAPSLSNVTDPVLGAVLGDENHEGLIPGLLNGVLGKK